MKSTLARYSALLHTIASGVHSKTHKLITELAFSVVAKDAILQIPKWFVENVVLSNVDLDRNPEYKREVILTKKGELKSVDRRVAHHTSSKGLVLKKLDRARQDVLNGNLTQEGAEELGEALHYIQDRCVISPKFDLKLHDRVEREAAKAHRELYSTVFYYAPRPLGRGELRELLENQVKRRAEDGVEALRCAAIYTFAALYAVLANPLKAPKDFVEKAVSARRAFSGIVRWVYAGVAIASLGFFLFLIALASPLAVGDLSFSMLAFLPVAFLAPCPYVCVLVLLALFSRDLQGFLKNLARATEPEKLFSAVAAVAFALTLPFIYLVLTVLVLASSTLVVFAPYFSSKFRMIREEVFWFEWD